MNYGSLNDDHLETGFGTEDPLLPPREPSTAESRSKRASVKRRKTAASRLPVDRRQTIMQDLFRDGKKKKKNEALQELVPSTGNGNGTPYQQQQQQSAPQQQATPHPTRTKNHNHTWLYLLLHPNSTHPHAVWYKWFISVVILVDVVFFVASTESAWSEANPKLFYYEEGTASTIFLLEYLCRIYVAPQSHKYHTSSTPWQARWKYMKTVSAMMDAASALPFFLELPTGLVLPNLTWIRFFRLVRILKTGSYAKSMETVWRVIYYNQEILYVALNMCILLVLVTAVLMYYLRPQNLSPEDAPNFRSLLSTMYLATLMLTGQGGPDGDLLPWYTKLVVLLTGFFSVAMFAIPASMLTWGFEAEAERCARKAQKKYYHKEQQQEEQEPDGNDDNNYLSTSSSEGDTTDEEYLNIIAGGEEEEEDATSQEEVVKKLVRTFQTSDVDASGSLSMDEFIKLMTSPEMASMGMVGMATSMGLLAQRVQHLEHELAQSHAKLDQLLEMVGKQNK